MAIAAIAGIASAAGAYGAAIAAGVAFKFTAFVTAFAIGAGLSIISRALMPKPNFGKQMEGLTSTIREPIASRKVIYGKMRVGGVVVFLENSNQNQDLYLVICFAAHKVEEFESIWFNDQKVWENGSFLSNWASYADFGIHKGDQTTSDSTLTSVSSKWTSTHVLNDIAYLRVKLIWDEDRKKFPTGVPNISAVIKGKPLYDPRKDSTSSVYDASLGVSTHRLNDDTTWEWTQNPALALRDYLTNTYYGLGESNDNIDLETFASVADTCDEAVSLNAGGTHDRYHCDGVVDTANSIKNNIEALVGCIGGRVGYVNGKYFVQAAKYETPTITISEEHIVGPISVQTKQSRRDTYNGVKGTFVSEEENWIVADYPSKTNATYATEDGDPIYLDMPLPFVTNQVRAQRLAQIALNRSRQQTLVNVPLNLAALQFKAGDFIQITNSRMGWTQKVFEVLDYRLDLNASGTMVCNVQAIETDSTVYDWTAGTDEDDYNEASDPSTDDGTTVNAPTGLTLTETADVQRDGTALSAIQVSFTASTSSFVDYYEVQAYPTADTSDKIFITTDETALLVSGLNNSSGGIEYTVRVRAVNGSGVKSSFVSGTVTLSGYTVTPTAPADFGVNGGFQTNTLSWTNPNTADFQSVEVYRSNTSGGTFTQIGSIGGNGGATAVFVDTNLPDTTTRYYKLKTVNRSQSKSAFSSEQSGTTNTPAAATLTPREQNGYVYYTSSSAGDPGTPSATSYSFSDGTFTGLTTGWQLNPVEQTGGDGKYWASRFFVVEASHGGSQTITFSSAFEAFTFDGLVTFTNLNTELADPSSTEITTIDGGHINTGLITLTGDTSAGMAIRLGKTSYTDTTAGFWLGNTGTSASITPRFNIGTSTKFLNFDGTDVETKGILIKDTAGNTVFDADEIDGVYIKDASVDTLQLAGNAVTLPEGADGAINVSLGTSLTLCGEITIDYGTAGKNPSAIIGVGSVQVAGDGSTSQTLTVVLRRVYGNSTFTGKENVISLNAGSGGQVVVGAEWPVAQISTYTSFKLEIYAKVDTGTRTANRYFITSISSKR